MATLDEFRPKQSRALVTVTSLLNAAIEEIETLGEDGVRVETVLEKAGVSIGSLYHHFGGREQLISAARVEQLRRFHENDLTALEQLLADIDSIEDLTARLMSMAAYFHAPDGADVRLRRLALLGSAVTRDALLAVTREARTRTNQVLIASLQDLKDRGILTAQVDPVAVTLFIQAFSFGQVLADIDGVRPDSENWTDLSRRVVLMVLGLADPV